MMEPSWAAMKWIESFGAYGMGEPSMVTRSDLPDGQSVDNQLGPSTTTPIAATNFNSKLSECVVGTIVKVSVTQSSSVQQNTISSSQLVAANRTI